MLVLLFTGQLLLFTGGLLIYDVTHPAHPEYVACNGQDSYTHDAQCVIYTGPDANYCDREVCAAIYN